MERPTVARGNNYGSRTWSGETIGGTVFDPAGPLAARTTYSVTDPTEKTTKNSWLAANRFLCD